MIKGRIHSIESFGTVDGPGTRMVVFFQGCPMRCLYCHNPDTWEINSGIEMTAEEILEQYEKASAFYQNGGITVTGGEPLLQLEFLIELFTEAKKRNINTCLDTSGIVYSPDKKVQIEKLMKVTDLILLDLKHIDEEQHKILCGHSNKSILEFARYLDKKKKPVWIRHVVVPGITLNKKHLYELGKFIATLNNVKALDVLPYHRMGEQKYEKLGMKYRLKGLENVSREMARKARMIILIGMRDGRN